MNVAKLRRDIDRIDQRIVALLNERATRALRIGREKRKAAAPVLDPSREGQVLANARKANRGPLSDKAVEAVYRQIMALCAGVQRRSTSNQETGFEDLANSWIAGLGIYEPGRPIEEVARELGFEDPSEVIKLASNENALGVSPSALRAMAASAGAMHRYPDGSAFYLRHALARKLGVSPDMVLPVNGSNEAIEFIGHVFLGAGSQVVVADRAFVVYALIAKLFQAGVIAVPMKDFTHDLDAMLHAITPDTKLIFIANPNNPTSTMVTRGAIERFMKRVPRHVVVCFDEAYVELLPASQQPETIKYVKQNRNVIILRTFSKAYGLAGLRMGYVVAPAACIRLMERVRQPFNVNAMGLAAAEAALHDDKFVGRTQRMVRDGLRFFTREFDQLKLEYVRPTANFVLVRVGNGRGVFGKMQERGVIVRPMDGYGLPDHIRITVGTAGENRRCMRALRAVLAGK